MRFSLYMTALCASFLAPRPTPEATIRARVLAFYRDDRAHHWPDVLDHFTVGKIAARWPPPVSDSVWLAAAPARDAKACEPAEGVPPSRMSITTVDRWARVFVTWCDARAATDEVWLLRIGQDWKIARLVRDVRPTTFP